MQYFDLDKCAEIQPAAGVWYNGPQGLRILGYLGSCEVSNQLVWTGGAWEEHETAEILRVLEQDEDVSQTPPVFVDIGAHIGWFTTVVAREGYEVYAFEGLPDNIRMLKATLCANKEIKDLVKFYPIGLGMKNQRCDVVAQHWNRGNGNVLCGRNGLQHRTLETQDYAYRGEMEIRRLDDIMDMDVRVLKIDVEGYEPWVIAGGARWLTQRKVMYILTDLSNLKDEDPDVPARYYYLLRGLGYRCSKSHFIQPDATLEDVTLEEIQQIPIGGQMRLFCTKEWFPMEE